MLLAVCSLKGSPGVTTLATALGARWPAGETPILVEADPAGGDLMARFRLNDAPGLVTLAVAA
jgi:MinD-like ATPase involved in chromosome partitioning or flagellar assembly